MPLLIVDILVDIFSKIIKLIINYIIVVLLGYKKEVVLPELLSSISSTIAISVCWP